MYHPHFDEMTQMAMGMVGMFIIHPRKRADDRVDRDFAIMLTSGDQAGTLAQPERDDRLQRPYDQRQGVPRHAPLVGKPGDRVRIRIGNLGAMDHHPIHIHGYYFRVTATDGGDIPALGAVAGDTVLVPVGSTRTSSSLPMSPGDWAFHCHMTHHVMNQMGHEFPNMIGVNPVASTERCRQLLPGYMTHGHTGMDMARWRT